MFRNLRKIEMLSAVLLNLVLLIQYIDAFSVIFLLYLNLSGAISISSGSSSEWLHIAAHKTNEDWFYCKCYRKSEGQNNRRRSSKATTTQDTPRHCSCLHHSTVIIIFQCGSMIVILQSLPTIVHDERFKAEMGVTVIFNESHWIDDMKLGYKRIKCTMWSTDTK